MEKREEKKIYTPTQDLFIEKYKLMIGDLLTLVEAVVPDSLNDRQWINTRKMLNAILYNARNEFLEKFVK